MVSYIIASSSDTIAQNRITNNITFFDTPEKPLSEKRFRVFQALEQGYALAESRYSNQIVLFTEDGKYYYDDETIEIPSNKCVRQIGVYKYTTNGGYGKTVPVVSIFDK